LKVGDDVALVVGVSGEVDGVGGVNVFIVGVDIGGRIVCFDLYTKESKPPSSLTQRVRDPQGLC